MEGFVRSIFGMLRVSLPVPDHTTLSRRGKDLKVILPKKVNGHLDIVMDSTGLKIYGEGEWKVRTHGKSKRRTWRKLHIGADPESGEIEAVALTKNSVDDAKMVEPLLQQIDQPIDRFAGDGSYDKRKVYDSLNRHAHQAAVLIPPRKNAHIWQPGNTQAERLKRGREPAGRAQAGSKSLERQLRYPYAFSSRNNYVPLQDHFRGPPVCAPVGDADDASRDLLCSSQPHDPSGHAG